MSSDLRKLTSAYDPYINVCVVWNGEAWDFGTIVSLNPLRWRWA